MNANECHDLCVFIIAGDSPDPHLQQKGSPNQSGTASSAQWDTFEEVIDTEEEDSEGSDTIDPGQRIGTFTPKREREREQSGSPSSGRNEFQNLSAQASGDRFQSLLKGYEDVTNMLSTGVKLLPNLVTRGAIQKSLVCTFHIVPRYKHTFFSLFSDSH